MASLAAAQAAKASLAQKLRGQPWVRGIGITQRKCYGDPAPYELQLNVASAAIADTLRACPQTAAVWMGVPLQIVVTGNISALGVSPETQGYADVALGAMTAAATFLIGKIVVENFLQSRRERFESKGQPPEAVKARETTMDGIMKLAGITFSIWQLSQQLPEVAAEAKKLLP